MDLRSVSRAEGGRLSVLEELQKGPRPTSHTHSFFGDPRCHTSDPIAWHSG